MMALTVYKRLTQPVFGPDGSVTGQPGDLIAADAPLDPAARYEYAVLEDGDPDPEAPAEAPAAAARHATVKPDAAAGKGTAHK